MKSILVFDLPARLLHGAFAASVSASLLIGLMVDDDSPLFQLHMILGIVAAFLVVVRVVWGFVGTRHARFAGFPLRPGQMVEYVTTILRPDARRHAGLNPGAAWASLAMYALVGLLVFTGIGAGGEAFEEPHEILAYALLGVVGLHLAGLAWHTIRHRENISAAMITGRKEGAPEDAIPSSRPMWALALLAGVAAWIGALFSGHDAKAGTVRIPGLGTVVQLGESESEDEGGEGERGVQGGKHGEKHDGDDDDD